MVAKGLVKKLSLSDVDIDHVIVDGINYPPRIYRMGGEWWVDVARHDSVDEVSHSESDVFFSDFLANTMINLS